MRTITLILLTYLTALLAAPCSDAVALSNRADSVSTAAHDHDDSTDSCSPFCVCTCCGISIENPQYYSLEISTPFFSYRSLKTTNKDFFMIDNFLTSIWQPPKY